MSPFRSLVFSSRVSLLALSLAVAALLPSCGGGGGDESPPTVRPKTLDGLVISLNNGPRLEFLRAATSGRALYSGDVETGTFVYSVPATNLTQYTNLRNDFIETDVRWPDSVSNMSYEYEATNDNTARLTLYAVGNNDATNSGTFTTIPGNQTPPLFSDFFTAGFDLTPSNEVEITLNFSDVSDLIELNTTITKIPATTTPGFDTMRVDGTIETSNGDDVPVNYNPEDITDAPSKIAQPTLHNLTIVFDNVGVATTFDFVATFTATTVFDPLLKDSVTDPDEEGSVALSINNGAVVIDAANYTWRRINGSDDAVLVLSGSSTTFDGSYTLAFAGLDNGDYIGTTDAGTPDVTEVTGTFFIPDAPSGF